MTKAQAAVHEIEAALVEYGDILQRESGEYERPVVINIDDFEALATRSASENGRVT